MQLLQPFLLSFLPFVAYAASGKGQVSLWSDSGCGQGDTSNFGERDPVALNYTLSADVCGNPGATVHSYDVTQRPTCDNGAEADFAFYNGKDCQVKGFGPALNGGSSSTDGVDGQCLALVEFNSVAFICNGLSGKKEEMSSSSVAKSTAVKSIATSSTSKLPIAPSATRTSPLSIGHEGSSIPGSVPAGTAPARGTGPSAGFPSPTTLSPAPLASTYSGAGSKFMISLVGVVSVVGGAFIL